MKINNRGFMMAELIVTSVIVLTALGGLYTSYGRIYSLYKTRLNYNNVDKLYRLAYYRDIMIEKNMINSVLNGTKIQNVYGGNNPIITTLPVIDAGYGYIDNAFIIYSQKKKISKDVLNSQSNIKQSYKEYVTFLSTSLEPKSNYLMIIESCKKVNGNQVDIDDCKYNYLEVYDGKE